MVVKMARRSCGPASATSVASSNAVAPENAKFWWLRCAAVVCVVDETFDCAALCVDDETLDCAVDDETLDCANNDDDDGDDDDDDDDDLLLLEGCGSSDKEGSSSGWPNAIMR